MVTGSSAAWFEFERHYSHRAVQDWVVENRHLSIVFGLIYFALLYVGRWAMKDRQPFSLRTVLSLWNAAMFILSFIICARLFVYSLKRAIFKPFQQQMCHVEYEVEPLIFWLDLFVISKPIEFIDTLFIVLRKQQLHFLHYYHHASVVILCWYSLGMVPCATNGLYYVAMNSFIHSIMYLYYLMRSMRIAVPRPVQMSITSMQIFQMILGCIINIAPLYYHLSGVDCETKIQSIILGLAIYLSYLILFSNFFVNAYFPSKKFSKTN